MSPDGGALGRLQAEHRAEVELLRAALTTEAEQRAEALEQRRRAEVAEAERLVQEWRARCEGLEAEAAGKEEKLEAALLLEMGQREELERQNQARSPEMS